MADRRRKKNDIEEAKKAGQKALEDAKAGRIQRVESENEVQGFAEIPYLQGGNSNFGDTSPSVAIDTPELPTVQQMSELSRLLQEQNASRNEQRRAERDSMPTQSRSESVPMDTSMAGYGPNVNAGTLRKTGSNSEFEDDIATLAQINDGSLMGVSVNPDLYAKSVTGTNDRKGMGLKDYYAYLQNKYDMSKDELDDLALTYKSNQRNAQSAELADMAQQYGEEHPVLGTLASLPMVLANSVEGLNNVLVGGLTGDERRLSRMASGTKQGFREGAKENIDSNGGKIAYDLGVGLGDLGVGVATGQAPAILAGNTANEATLGAVDRGQSTRKAALYGTGAGVVDYITNTIGLDKAKSLAMERLKSSGIRNTLAKMGIAAASEAGENVIQDIAQTFLDEVINDENSESQTELRERIASGESVEEAFKNTLLSKGKNLLMSAGTGALMGAGMFGGTAAVNGLRGRLGSIPRLNDNPAIPSEGAETEIPHVTPEDLARQNEIDVNEKVDNVNQAVDEINNLAEQIPQSGIDPAHELAGRYAAAYESFNDYDAMDNVYDMDGFVEGMADDIANGRSLSKYIDALEENIDDAPDEEIRASMQSLIDELKRVDETNGNRLTADEVEALQRGVEQSAAEETAMNEAIASAANNAAPANRELENRIRQSISDLEMSPETRSAVEDSMKTFDDLLERIDNAQSQEEIEALMEEAERIGRDADNLLKGGAQSRLIAKNQFDEDTRSFVNAINGTTIKVPDNLRGEFPDQTLKQLQQRLHFYGEGKNYGANLRKGSGTPIESLFEDIDNATGHALSGFMESQGYNIDSPEGQLKALIEYADTLKANQNTSKVMDYNGGIFDDWYQEMVDRSVKRNGELMRGASQVDSPIPARPEVPSVPNQTVDDVAEPLENTGIPKEAESAEITSDNVNPPSDVPLEGSNPPSRDMGLRRTYTNTGVKAGIVDPHDLENNPVTQRDAQYEIHHNADVSAEARQTLDERHDMYAEEYSSGTREVKEDIDLDRAMMLAEDDRTSSWMKDSILRNIAEHGTKAGQFIQAFAKWADTSTGSLAKATKVLVDRTNKWKSSNIRGGETNNKVAQAINGENTAKNKQILDMMNRIANGELPSTEERTPVSYGRFLARIRNSLQDSSHGFADKLDDLDAYYVGKMLEAGVPKQTIEAQLRNRIETGEWNTLDESLPIKEERALKNAQLSNMLDRLINGEGEKSEKAPQDYGTFLKGIRNSLSDDSLGIADKFNDNDVYFLGTLMQEKVPKKIIEAELKHKIETGEWFTIDESIQLPKRADQRIQNAFKKLRGEDVKPEPVEKTFNQVREEVKNSLEKEGVLNKYSDADIDYLTNLRQQGASTQYIADALNTKEATGSWGIKPETQQRVNEIYEEIRHYDPNSQAFVERQLDALRLLAEEVAPNATALEKFDAWRYMAMLGNPKTMFRNSIGNKLFSAVTGMSNNLSALLEKGVDKAYNAKTGEHIQRTKEFLNPIKDKALIDSAKNDAREKRFRQIEGSKYEKMDRDSLKRDRSVWNSKLMRLAEKAVDKGISDTNAVINKYATSLAGYMKANGLGQDAFDATYKFDALERAYKSGQILTADEISEMESLRELAGRMEKARDYALKQAEYSTFHEDNAVAQAISKLSSDWRNSESGGVRAMGYALEGTIPFKKTPANILKSGYEYSPFGIISSIAKTGKLIVENSGKNKGNLADEYTKVNKLTGREKTVQKSLAADVIDSWSKTFSGSLMALLGYYLFNKGILTSSDKGEKYQDQLEGKGNYAININGHTYTLDWAAPGVMPLLVGAEASKVFKKNGMLDEAWYSNPDQWMQTINGLLDPMLETSMLSGLKDTLQTAANEVRYNEDNALGGILGSIASNTLTGYLTQGIPTLSGQFARTIDPTRRTTDTENEGILGTFEKQGRKVANKIPGLSFLNTPFVDAYGRQQTNGPFDYSFDSASEIALDIPKLVGNLGYQMLSPGYYSRMRTTPGDEKGRELFNALDENGKAIKGVTGEEKLFADWRSTKKINGVKLDPKQMVKFRTEMGTANREFRNALAENEWFNSLDPVKQTEIFKSLNTISDKIGQYAVMPKSVSVGSELKTYLEAGGGEEGVKAVIEQMQYKNMTKDAEIKSNSNIGKVVQEAVDNGNVEQAQQIVENTVSLQSLGLDKPGPAYAYENAQNIIPGLTVEQFADTYKAMDADGNQGLKQSEIIDYLNSNNISSIEGGRLWNAYGNGTWKKIPVLGDDGVWSLKAK